VSFIYDYGLEWIAKNDITTADLRLFLVMADSTCGSERGAKFVADFAVRDEYDAVGYVRKDLAAVLGTLDLTSHFEKVTATAPVWTTLAAASKTCIGMVLFVFITNDAASRNIAFINDSPLFPFNGIGDDVTLTPSPTTGILRLAN